MIVTGSRDAGRMFFFFFFKVFSIELTHLFPSRRRGKTTQELDGESMPDLDLMICTFQAILVLPPFLLLYRLKL